MKQILLTTILTLYTLVGLFAQEEGDLYGMSFSETDFQEADFFTLQPKDGGMKVLSIAKGMGIFSIGASTIDDWRREYLIWGQTAGYKSSGFLFDQASGQLIRKIETEQPPIDLQYDMRLRQFYGLRYMPNRAGIEIVRVDGQEVQTLWKLKDIKFLSVGNTAFDSNRGLYVFIARDAKNNTRLYRVNVANGSILDEPLIEDYIFNEFQYDIQDNKLYAFARKKSNISQYFFVEINMLNAYPTIIRPMVGMKKLELGRSAFNQKKGSYFFVGEDKKEKTHLYELDVLGGSIYTKNELNETISELHYDNSTFVGDFYKNVKMEDYQDFRQGSDTKSYPKSGDSHELFEEFYVHEEIKLRDIDFITDETITAIVFDKFNNKMIEQKVFLTDLTIKNNVLVKDLPPGIYVLKLKTGNRTYSQRFVKK